MSIHRQYEETALQQFLDGKGQSMTNFEQEVIGGLRRFINAYRDHISACLITTSGRGVVITMNSRSSARDEFLINAQHELGAELIENGWPEIELLAVPAVIDAERFSKFAARKLSE